MLIQTRLVQDRFPDLVAAAVEHLPPGLVLDGELLVWDPVADALPYEALQRRASARGSAALAARANPLNSRYLTGRRGGDQDQKTGHH
ncbi:hypothetical protein [Streptomyces sp. NPDC085540]|uniref:hypothetical protein n=1 Tax=Streptomyces sp. NPDC085540 TaxID=3365730 RepID=UPI0037CDB458